MEIIKSVGVDNGYTSLDCQVNSLGLDRIDSCWGCQTVQCTMLKGNGKEMKKIKQFFFTFDIYQAVRKPWDPTNAAAVPLSEKSSMDSPKIQSSMIIKFHL